QIDLVQMPSHTGLRSALAQVRCNNGPEMVHPAPNGLIGDRNTAFCQQIFDVTKAQREPEIEPDRLLDDLGREPVTFVADFLHSVCYLTMSETARQNRRDKALPADVCSARLRSHTAPWPLDLLASWEILVGIHSVLRASLRFADISVHGRG